MKSAELMGISDLKKSLMAGWLQQAPQWHEVYCHDLEVMSLNPGWVEIWVRGTSLMLEQQISIASASVKESIQSKSPYI